MTMKTTLAGRVVAKVRGYVRTVQPPGDLGLVAVEVSVPIQSPADILDARKKGREVAGQLGFSPTDCTLIATAISELARNIVLYAGYGEMSLGTVSRKGKTGIVIIASDKGPRTRASRGTTPEGFSTSREFGLGLPGVKRIMDEFEVVSKPGIGSTVTVRKWKAR
jgi:serine/threonine-protein kinase RsbT